MSNVDLLSKRLVNWPDQQALRGPNNGAELAKVADALGLQLNDVQAAVQRMGATGFSGSVATTNALAGQSATAAPLPTGGNLGWTEGAAGGPDGVPLSTFLLDISSFGAVSPRAEGALVAYLQSFGLPADSAAAAAKVMFAFELDQPLPKALEPQAHAALTALEGKVGQLSDDVSLANKQVFKAKSDALGKAFYEPGTFKQMKNPEILHRDLRDSPVTNPTIEAAKAKHASLEQQLAEVRSVYSSLRTAGEEFAYPA